VAGFNMRTWFNKLPRSAHPAAASAPALHGKKRVPVPVLAGSPYAIAKGRAAADAELSIRRTPRALAERVNYCKKQPG